MFVGNRFSGSGDHGSVSELFQSLGYEDGANYDPAVGFAVPTAIALDSSNDVFVANGGGGVSELTASSSHLNGNDINDPGAQFANPDGIATDSFSNLWVSNGSGGLSD